MIEIQIDDMRAAGKPGYVAKIIKGERMFIKAVSQNKYGTSRVGKTYQITDDGVYEICDANFGGRKRRLNFIKVENKEIVAESQDITDLLLNKDALIQLEGTDAQLSYGTAIRQDYLLKLLYNDREVPEWVSTQNSAKWWIENKHLIVEG